MVAYNQPALQQRALIHFIILPAALLVLPNTAGPMWPGCLPISAQRWPYAFPGASHIGQGYQSRSFLCRSQYPGSMEMVENEYRYWRWPVIVKDGFVNVTNEEEQMFVKGENDRHPRTVIGYTRKRQLIILAIQGRFPGVAEGATLAEEAK